MAVEFRLKGFDDLFEQAISGSIVVNDLDGSSKESKRAIDDLIMCNYTGDTLSLVPSCTCGELFGNHYLGMVCPTCNTQVTSIIEEELTYNVWIRQPVGVAKLISPFLLAILSQRYKVTFPSVNLIHYIMQTSFIIKGKSMKNLDKIKQLDFILASENIPKGYNSFVSNFYRIIEILEMNFSNVSKKEKLKFLEWIKGEQEESFSTYIPLPNRSLFVFDTNETGSYVDRDMLDAISSIRRMTGIDIYGLSILQKQNKVARSIMDLAEFYSDYIKKSFFGKQGLIRKHISRSRSHFTLRAVVTSRSDVHKLNEIELPWSASCSLFREQILKGLSQRGYAYKKALDYFMRHIKKYSPLIDEIFSEILRDSEGGIPCLLNRNPSLHRGSIVFVKAVKIKKDVRDNTMSVSYLLSPVFNMDFDGDMLNLTPLFTKYAVEEAKNFEMYHNLLGLNAPNEFSGAIGFPKTTISTLSNWYYKKKAA